MAEYIEREAAKKKHCEICMEMCICYRNKSTCNDLKAFDLIPAADVRHVVLCRDCQFFENDCGWCGYFDIGMNANDFCSRGKREES